MHCSYYFINKFTHELRPKIEGLFILDCFTQSKNELIISFGTEEKELHLLANINRDFNAFSVRESFSKAKSKYTNCFTSILNVRIEELIQIPYDRSFYLKLSNDKKLLFKWHGNRSNIILIDSNHEVETLFNSKLKGDLSLNILDLEKEKPEVLMPINENNIASNHPLFNKKIEQFLLKEGWKESEEKEKLILSTEEFLEDSWEFYLEESPKPNLSLFKNNSRVFLSAIESSNELYYKLLYYQGFTLKKETLIKSIEKNINQTERYLKKTNDKLKALKAGASFRQKADVLMANLHVVKEPETTYELENFYGEKAIVVKLKVGEKAQDLASKWYRKEKNQYIEIQRMQESIDSKETYLFDLLEKKEELLNLTKDDKRPFKYFEINGYQIFIGRNSKNNDELLRFAQKDDLWLHAKDVPGSHVLIKVKKQNNTPKTVIERAAELAAYYSKRKQDSLCPVMVTPRKYVRKKKGFLPGQVTVEKEDVILVVPKGL